jgi:MAPEG family
LFRKQLAVVLGAGTAVALLLLAWARLDALPLPLPDGDDTASRLAFVGRWLLLPGLSLLFGIGLVANQRFFVADAIDGGPSESTLIRIALRYNTNTVEQTILAAIAWTGLALALPHEQLKLIPAMAISFLVGRALFFVGYMIAPVGRALGLGLTAYPSFAALVWLALRMF